jgi:hypothetical protein
MTTNNTLVLKNWKASKKHIFIFFPTRFSLRSHKSSKKSRLPFLCSTQKKVKNKYRLNSTSILSGEIFFALFSAKHIFLQSG